MTYEKTPIVRRIHKSAIDQRLTDITKMSTPRIAFHLLQRHQNTLVTLAVGMVLGLVVTA